MTDAVKRYDDARVAFLNAIKSQTAQTEKEAKAALNTPEEHDYLKYLATSFGALGQAVACHTVLPFEAWKRDFCGGHRVRPRRPLEEH